MKHVAVIGAGWAGLAAAVRLHNAGCKVTVFDLSHTPGGRAQRVERPGFQAPLDNGQHILIGAYQATLNLMRRLGRDPSQLLWRLPLTLAAADGSFRLRAPQLPAPWHMAAALLGMRGPSLRQRLSVTRMITKLRRSAWQAPNGTTVSQLLHDHAQPLPLIKQLWHPLCVAALNTLPNDACAQLFCNVLRDSLDSNAASSNLLLPRSDLSSLWPDAAAERCDMRYGQPVRSLVPSLNDVQLGGETFEAVVVATPPYMAARLLNDLPDAGQLVQSLRAFRYSPIATFTVQLASGMKPLAAPMLMLNENPARGHFGQWLFDRTSLLQLDPAKPELSVVCSVAEPLTALPRRTAMQRLHAQLANQLALPPVTNAELIIEKRATFRAVPGLMRPGNITPWPRVVLAGDYTNTGYPGVLEGAVISGNTAADALIAAASR